MKEKRRERNEQKREGGGLGEPPAFLTHMMDHNNNRGLFMDTVLLTP